MVAMDDQSGSLRVNLSGREINTDREIGHEGLEAVVERVQAGTGNGLGSKVDLVEHAGHDVDNLGLPKGGEEHMGVCALNTIYLDFSSSFELVDGTKEQTDDGLDVEMEGGDDDNADIDYDFRAQKERSRDTKKITSSGKETNDGDFLEDVRSKVMHKRCTSQEGVSKDVLQLAPHRVLIRSHA